MKTLVLASRNGKKTLRDQINLFFGIGFPVILLLLLTIIQSNAPVVLFPIDKLDSGISVFGLSFLSLFSGVLIAKDRTSSFMVRLLVAPLTSSDFIFGYTVPMVVLQGVACFTVAFSLGLDVSINVMPAIVVLVPASVLLIAMGLLASSLFNEKQVGGVCGALLTNLSAWLSGTWFDLDLVGGAFKRVAEALPFVCAVNAARAALSGNYSSVFPDLWWVIGYAAVIMMIAILVFTRKTNSDNT